MTVCFNRQYFRIACRLCAAVLIGVAQLLSDKAVANPARDVLAGFGLHDVQSFDLYQQGSALHALIAARGIDGRQQQRLLYLRSRDGGASWSEPIALPEPASGGPIVRRGNDAQLAVAGRTVVAAWQGAGELPGAGPLVIAYSRDGGSHWKLVESPAAASDPTQNQSYPDLLADASGRFHLVWLDDREENGNTQGLRYAVSGDGGRSWTEQTTIDGSVCTCCWNRLFLLPNGDLSVLYRDVEPHDMTLAIRRSGSSRWARLSSVGMFNWQFAGCPHCGGGLATQPRGARDLLHGVVWTGQEATPGLFYLRSDDRGRHWKPLLRIGDGHDRQGDVAARATRRVAIVYAKESPGNSAIQFIQSSDAGSFWSEPLTLTAPGALADHPRILATAEGFRVFWTERRENAGKVLVTMTL